MSMICVVIGIFMTHGDKIVFIFVMTSYNRGLRFMDVFVYSDGRGGVFGYKALSDFLRGDHGGGLDASERTLRGVFAHRDIYLHTSIPNCWLKRVSVIAMQRKKVRPKYLFGKPY